MKYKFHSVTLNIEKFSTRNICHKMLTKRQYVSVLHSDEGSVLHEAPNVFTQMIKSRGVLNTIDTFIANVKGNG